MDVYKDGFGYRNFIYVAHFFENSNYNKAKKTSITCQPGSKKVLILFLKVCRDVACFSGGVRWRQMVCCGDP